MAYRTFTRTWWKSNPDYPDGREPHIGRKTIYTVWYNEQQAREECQEWNKTHNPGKLSRKMEYEEF